MKIRMGIISVGAASAIVGWLIRGQGTYYNNKQEYTFGMFLISVGLATVGIGIILVIKLLYDKKHNDNTDTG